MFADVAKGGSHLGIRGKDGQGDMVEASKGKL